MPSVLLIGATGMYGVPLALQLKQIYPNWPLTVYYRNPKGDSYFRDTVHADRIVHGTFEEHDRIKALAAEHELVINSGSSFDADLTRAVLAGMKTRPRSAKGTLIHLSGCGNFTDEGTSGKYNPASKVWNDANEDDIKLVNPKMLNGGADRQILDAGNEGSVNTFIVCCALTYGSREGPWPALGVGYMILTENAKQVGFVPYVGDGSAILSTIHIDDAIPFILTVVKLATTEEVTGSAESRFYIIHGERVAWKDVSTVLAKVLYEKGIMPSPEARGVPLAQAGEGEIPMLLSSNMLVKGDRADALGFKPTKSSILEYLANDISTYLDSQ